MGAFKRDSGRCAVCGIDAEALLAALRDLAFEATCPAEPWSERARSMGRRWGWWWRAGGGSDTFNDFLHTVGLTWWRLAQSLWEADHIVPVWAGGGGTGLANIQTLCWRCHARRTLEQARERADAKAGRLSLRMEGV